MKFYNIQSVSQICGLSTHCIRAWEKRYGAVSPLRSENGRRIYSEKEVNRLLMLGKLSSLGNSISLMANLPDNELEQLIKKMTARNGSAYFVPTVQSTNSLLGPKSYLNNLFMALNSWKLDVLTHELNKASKDLNCKAFALEVIANLFRKVGEYVLSGKMSIAQEHTLTAITKFFIGRRIYQHYDSDYKGTLKICLATPSGEYHSIGLLLSALLMVEYNLKFVYLGENLPEESIAEAVKATEADIVLLSVSPAFEKLNKDINEVLINLRKFIPSDKEIWIGGDCRFISSNTIHHSNITTIESLESLDDKLTRLVNG